MKKKELRTLDIGTLFRTFEVDQSNIDVENRLVKIALSSEEPYPRWFGTEILSHDPKHVDLSRMSNGAPLLAEHDTTKQIGRIMQVSVDKDRVMRCIVKFSKNPLATEYFNDVIDGIRTKVSIGYQINGMTKIGEEYNERTGETVDVYLIDDWTGNEGSFVSVAADDTVGVGRSLDTNSVVKSISVKEMEEETEGENSLEGEKGKTSASSIEEEQNEDMEEDDNEEEEEDKSLKEAETLEIKAVEEIITPTFDKGLNNSENSNIEKKSNNNNKKDSKTMNKEILELGRKHNQLELAVKYFEEDKTVEDFKNVLLEIKSSGASQVDDGTRKEMNEFNIAVYMNELANDNKNGRMYNMAKEFDQDFKGRGKMGGFVLPRSVFVQSIRESALRDYTVANPGQAAVLHDQFRAELFDVLYNNSVMMPLVSVLPSATGNASVTYPLGSGKNSFQYLGENDIAASTSQSNLPFEMTPKTIGGRSVVSREMLKQGGLRPVEAYVVSTLLKDFDEWKDNELINGDGVGKHILGLLNQTGVNVIDATNTKYAGNINQLILDMEGIINYKNAGNNGMTYLTNSLVASTLKGTQQFASYGMPILSGNQMNGMNVATSNQIHGTGGKQAIALVNREHLKYIEWDGYELVANDKRLGGGQIEFELFSTLDFKVTRPEGLSICKNF